MPSLESQFRKQKAVYWEANGYDGYGEPNVNTPVELDVRWVEKQLEATDANGGPIAIDATVVMDRKPPVGSVLWLGELADLPSPPTDLKKVIMCDVTPDVKCRNTFYTAMLQKLSDKLPTASGV